MAHRPQCCCSVKPLFLFSSPRAGNTIYMGIRMHLTNQGKSNLVKINTFISSHVLSNKGMDFN